jgi:hypothetical protein
METETRPKPVHRIVGELEIIALEHTALKSDSPRTGFAETRRRERHCVERHFFEADFGAAPKSAIKCRIRPVATRQKQRSQSSPSPAVNTSDFWLPIGSR